MYRPPPGPTAVDSTKPVTVGDVRPAIVCDPTIAGAALVQPHATTSITIAPRPDGPRDTFPSTRAIDLTIRSSMISHPVGGTFCQPSGPSIPSPLRTS